MKVIIDIPKEGFESVKSDEPIDFLDAMHLISTIQNGIPLEEELGKIKVKITRWCNGYLQEEIGKDINKIIDNHIAELKGE